MENYKELQEIPTHTKEGRFLLAALAKITTESQTDKTPNEVIDQLYELQNKMFKDDLQLPNESELPKFDQFQKEVEVLVNRLSLENHSNTPDFMIAEHLTGALKNYGKSMQNKWHYDNRPFKAPVE